MTTPIEARARRLVGAYPWRFRTDHGDEIVATVLDALPPDADRLPWRAQLDLLRGGLTTRWRRRLSLGAHLRYALRMRLADRWLPWVVDDLEAPGYRRREVVRATIGVAVVVAVIVATGERGWWELAAVAASGVVVAAWRAPTTKREIAHRHGLAGSRRELGTEWVLAPERSLVPNLPVARLIAAVAVPMGLAGVAAVVAAARPVPIPALDEPYHSAEPVPVGLLVVAAVAPVVIGVATGVLLALNAMAVARQVASPAERVVSHRSSTTVLAVVLALVTAVVLGYGAVLVLARMVPWEAGMLGAALAPVSAGLLVVAWRWRRAGRRRGTPVGLWEVAPRLTPRRRVVAIARGTIDLMPGAEPLPPAHPRPTARSAPPSG